MTKTNRLSKIFMILLFVAVAVALTFAFVNVPNGAANAEETYTTHTQSNNLQIDVLDNFWTVEDVGDKQTKYTATKNKNTTPTLKFTIEGEQYFSFEYMFPNNTSSGYFTVDIDDVQQCKVDYKGANTTPQEYIMKTHGEGQHTVVVWANAAKASSTTSQKDIYFQNFRLRADNDFTKHNLKMDYNEKFLATYIVEGGNGGWSGDKDTEEQIKAAATYLAPNQEYPIPEGISFCFISFPKAYVSSISGEEVKSPMLSNHIQSADGKKQLSSSGGGAKTTVTGCKITNTGIRQAQNDHANTGSTSWQCAGYDLKDITCEYAPLPQVSYYENNDMAGAEHVLTANETVTLPYGKTSLSVCIKSTLADYADYYKVKVDGIVTPVSWERIDENHIAGAINVTKRSTVLVSGWFGQDYIYIENGSTSGKLYADVPDETNVDEKLSFAFNIDVATENGIKDILANPQADISVEQDENYPWYYDPSRGEEGMAFTSGLSGASAEAKKISQLGFTVKGNGVFIFEFQIDGTGSITG